MKLLLTGLLALVSLTAFAAPKGIGCFGKLAALPEGYEGRIGECSMEESSYDSKKTGSLQGCSFGITDYNPGGHHIIQFREMPEKNGRRRIEASLYTNTGNPVEVLEISAEEDNRFYDLRSRFKFTNGSIASCASVFGSV